MLVMPTPFCTKLDLFTADNLDLDSNTSQSPHILSKLIFNFIYYHNIIHHNISFYEWKIDLILYQSKNGLLKLLPLIN